MRRSVPSLLLVAALALPLVAAVPASDPGPASEGAATDACRDANPGPSQACDAVRSFTHGAAAFCRRAGQPDVCTPLNGQRIAEEEVTAFENGWVADALALQRRLQVDLPLRHATFVATHNSYNSYAYRPTPSRTDANQSYSMTDQLRLGVRRLELDIHTWYDATTGQEAPILCHATDEPARQSGIDTPPTRHTGCTAEMTLADGLAEIDAWLDAHPDDFLMLRLETHLDGEPGYDAAAADLTEVLGDHLIRPTSGTCEPFPMDATPRSLAARGQVLLVSGCGDGSTFGPLVFDDGGVRVESTYRGEDFSYPSCGGFGREDGDGDVTYETHWIRYYDDATFVSSMTSLGSEGPQRTVPSVVREWTRCGVNQPSFDHLTPTDGRLEALVWSWAEGEGAVEGPQDCAVQTDSRFASRDCLEEHPYVCATGTGFAVTERAGRFSQGDVACRAEHRGELAVPRNGYEATVIAALAGSSEVWIDLHETRGAWVTDADVHPGRGRGLGHGRGR